MIYKTVVLACFLAGIASANANSQEKLFWSETFNEDPFSNGKWVKSSNEKYDNTPAKIMSSISAPDGFKNDNGIQLTQEMKHYGFGSRFPSELSLQNELVVQYEVKMEETLTCGGAYVKLPRSGNGFDMANLKDDTPYSIMFGPDKCGGTNKVHFILQHQNPLTKKWEEKHFNDTPSVKTDKKTHLYSLVVRKDNSFEIFIDKKSAKKGNLLTHMTPPINPPKDIDDPSDKKPSDWVDEAEIDDPEASKPLDWDEDAPRTIVDPKATKPSGWLDNGPEKIPDPEASRPSDWDDEEDGVWEAPEVDNPACEKVGCGVWKAPTIKNPDYKGKWKAPKIANKLYKGVWEAKKIPNPDFFEDLQPATGLAPMAGLAVEIWTTVAGIHFDNFAVTHSLADAFAFADSTFTLKQDAEGAEERAQQREESKKAREEKLKSENLKDKLEGYLALITDYLTENPIALAGTVFAVILTVVLSVFLVSGSGTGKPPPPPPHTDEDSPSESSPDKATPTPTTPTSGETTPTESAQDATDSPPSTSSSPKKK